MNIVVKALISCAFNTFFKRHQRQRIKQQYDDKCKNGFRCFIMMGKEARTSLPLKPFYMHTHIEVTNC